jgi:hypothetical protein
MLFFRTEKTARGAPRAVFSVRKNNIAWFCSRVIGMLADYLPRRRASYCGLVNLIDNIFVNNLNKSVATHTIKKLIHTNVNLLYNRESRKTAGGRFRMYRICRE